MKRIGKVIGVIALVLLAAIEVGNFFVAPQTVQSFALAKTGNFLMARLANDAYNEGGRAKVVEICRRPVEILNHYHFCTVVDGETYYPDGRKIQQIDILFYTYDRQTDAIEATSGEYYYDLSDLVQADYVYGQGGLAPKTLTMKVVRQPVAYGYRSIDIGPIS